MYGCCTRRKDYQRGARGAFRLWGIAQSEQIAGRVQKGWSLNKSR
jgi:hypothetical protein